jgi:glycosyltransferase involved in cell wall biosynthesis
MNPPGAGRRILFVDEDAGRSGSTVSLEYLLRGFRSEGYEVFVLTLKKNPVFLARLAESAVVIEVRKWKMSSMGLNLYFTNTLSVFSVRGMVVTVKEIVKSIIVFRIVLKAIRETRADLVYVNEYVLVPAYVAALLLRIPAVVHIRSQFLKGTFGVRRALLSRLIPACCRAVIAITRIEAAQLHPRRKDAARITIVGEFVPGSGSAGSSAAESACLDGLDLPAGSRIVTMLGGILSIKGSIDFLRAAVRVVRIRREVVFVIAGRVFKDETAATRSYYDACMKPSEELQSMGCLRITGEITDTAGLIAASDILVSPSPQTHFSRPVIEAWARSKPVVATRTAHMSDLVGDGVDGFLVGPGDDGALAERLLRLLDDSELCRRMGREGKKKAETLFDADRNIRKIVGICERLATAPHGDVAVSPS